MKIQWKTLIHFAVFASVLFCASSALADRIYLVNGAQITGTLVSVSAINVQFRAADGVLQTYQRAVVQRIDLSAPAPTPALPSNAPSNTGATTLKNPVNSPSSAPTTTTLTYAVPMNTGSNVPQAQAEAALDFHNAKRKDVGVPPLQWSVQLAGVAQKWANHLAQANACNLEHTQNNSYGENLFGGQGGSYTVVSAAEDWYSEVSKFHYGVLTDSNWYPTGHYTQMIWRNTTQLGMGQATCPGGSIVIVAEYNPPGNYMGEKPY